MSRHDSDSYNSDEWDAETDSELIPLIDHAREISEKNKKIAKLERSLKEKDEAVKILKTLHGSKHRRFYWADLLMLLLTAITIYAYLKK